MKTENLKKILAAGMVSCLLTGCGNVIPELTEEEASLIATYAADVTLSHSRESDASRLIDTEAESARLEELAEKIEAMQKEQELEEEEEAKPTEYSSSAGGAEESQQKVENIADFIGLDGFQVSYDGYEIRKSYAADETEEWEPTLDATAGKSLLVVKLKVTNISGAPAVADVLSKDMMFSISADGGVSNMAFVTMLLNDFAFAQDEIGAGESKQYVLITQIDENITEVGSISLHMKKGDENLIITLQ